MTGQPSQAMAQDDERQRPPVSGKSSQRKQDKPHAGSEDDNEQFLDVRVLRDQYMDYLTLKVDEIEEQKNARRYYHSVQYTAEQLRILKLRHQPPMTWNRISRKLNGIIGLMERMRSDPKSEPTSPKSEAGADIATHVIRTVLDTNEWKMVEPWCLLQASIDGIGGVQMVMTKGDEGDPDIALPWVIGDEYFYDPKSYRPDFSDARYQGISKWLDIDEAIELFPDKEDVLRGLIQGDSDLMTNADREYKWIITSSKRVRLVEHWYKHRGQWCWAFYVSNCLLDEGLSPFYDERGKRCSSFRMFSIAVDHDGDRYGFFRNLKGPQDSLNQSKSKSLHLANSRRLIGEKGAVDDVEKTRIEWARPDGYVEVNPGKQIKPDDVTIDLQAFSKFAEDAGAELDSFANTNIAAMVGATQLSGRAIEMLRQPGMAELGIPILAIRGWKLQIYRSIWNTAQRYWTAQRWLRVTNDKGLQQFIQLNGLGADEFGRPALVNALGAVHVNITFDEGRDVASLMEEISDALKGYPPGTFPPQVLIEMSTLPRADKDRIIQMMTPKPKQPDPMALANAHLELEGKAVKNAKTAADARKSDASATQSLAKIHEGASQQSLDYAQFQHELLKEAAELMQPQQPAAPQQGAQPQPGMPQ